MEPSRPISGRLAVCSLRCCREGSPSRGNKFIRYTFGDSYERARLVSVTLNCAFANLWSCRRCLQKDARKRLQSIGDARIEIEECLDSQDSTDSVDPDGSIGGQEPARQSVRKPLLAAFLAAALVVLAGLVGWWLKGTRTRTFNWTGTAVPGSNIAFGPRISPDGHMLAFQAMVGNLTQVAVVNLDSGTWAVLTHDENRGFVNEISWAPDGSKLFFDRVVAVPKGIYSVPAMGGAERLVLEDAGTPETLPDGTLIVARNDTASRLRIYHSGPIRSVLIRLPAG